MEREAEPKLPARARRPGAVAALLSALLAFGCGGGLEEFEVPRSKPPRLPPAVLEGVTFQGFRGEQRELFVTAARAKIDLDERVASLEQVTFSFSEDNRGEIEIAAPVGELALDADDFVLSGGVVGSAQRGERFSTESLSYTASTRELSSSTPVELTREDLTVRANGMKLGLDARRLRLLGAVRAEVKNR